MPINEQEIPYFVFCNIASFSDLDDLISFAQVSKRINDCCNSDYVFAERVKEESLQHSICPVESQLPPEELMLKHLQEDARKSLNDVIDQSLAYQLFGLPGLAVSQKNSSTSSTSLTSLVSSTSTTNTNTKNQQQGPISYIFNRNSENYCQYKLSSVKRLVPRSVRYLAIQDLEGTLVKFTLLGMSDLAQLTKQKLLLQDLHSPREVEFFCRRKGGVGGSQRSKNNNQQNSKVISNLAVKVARRSMGAAFTLLKAYEMRYPVFGGAVIPFVIGAISVSYIAVGEFVIRTVYAALSKFGLVYYFPHVAHEVRVAAMQLQNARTFPVKSSLQIEVEKDILEKVEKNQQEEAELKKEEKAKKYEQEVDLLFAKQEVSKKQEEMEDERKIQAVLHDSDGSKDKIGLDLLRYILPSEIPDPTYNLILLTSAKAVSSDSSSSSSSSSSANKHSILEKSLPQQPDHPFPFYVSSWKHLALGSVAIGSFATIFCGIGKQPELFGVPRPFLGSMLRVKLIQELVQCVAKRNVDALIFFILERACSSPAYLQAVIYDFFSPILGNTFARGVVVVSSFLSKAFNFVFLFGWLKWIVFGAGGKLTDTFYKYLTYRKDSVKLQEHADIFTRFLHRCRTLVFGNMSNTAVSAFFISTAIHTLVQHCVADSRSQADIEKNSGFFIKWCKNRDNRRKALARRRERTRKRKEEAEREEEGEKKNQVADFSSSDDYDDECYQLGEEEPQSRIGRALEDFFIKLGRSSHVIYGLSLGLLRWRLYCQGWSFLKVTGVEFGVRAGVTVLEAICAAIFNVPISNHCCSSEEV